MNKINGIVSVVPTPLTDNESVDFKGIENIVEFLVEQNYSMFALGSAGEGMNLTFKDRVAVARKIAKVNNGRVPLLIGGGGFGVKDIVEFIGEIDDCKIDGIHVIPYDNKVSSSTVESFYMAIADRSSIPIWLYQNTTRTKGIPLEVVQRLKKHPNIHGIKLAGFDLRVNQGFININSNDFQVFGSADLQMFSFFCHGLSASSSSAAICFPELFNELYEVMQIDSIKKARIKHRQLMDFLKRMPNGAYLDNGEHAAEIKYILSLRGICQEYVAAPWRMLTEDEKQQCKLVYQDYLNFLETSKL